MRVKSSSFRSTPRGKSIGGSVRTGKLEEFLSKFVNSITVTDLSGNLASLATPPFVVSPGNHICLCVYYYSSSGIAPNIPTDSAGNIYQSLPVGPLQIQVDGSIFRVYYVENANEHAANIITVAWPSNVNYAAIVVLQHNGIISSSSLDVYASGLGTTPEIISGLFTTNYPDSLIVSFAAQEVANQIWESTDGSEIRAKDSNSFLVGSSRMLHSISRSTKSSIKSGGSGISAGIIAAAFRAGPQGSGGIPISITDFGGYRPHYQGWGTGIPTATPLFFGLVNPDDGTTIGFNKGGRGGDIYLINTLADNNDARVQVSPGIYRCSLRRALATETGPRIIMFEVSGIIMLTLGSIIITSPYITIAAQTAPSPGINIRGNQIQVNTHDVVMQHLRFRYDNNIGTISNTDTWPIYIGGTSFNPNARIYNVVIDHCSVAFANGYVSIGSLSTASPWDVSVLDCIVAWPLSREAVHPVYGGYGIVFWPRQGAGVTAARNIIIHTSHRNIRADLMKCQVLNNFMYGGGPNSGFGIMVSYFQSVAQGQCTTESDPACREQWVGINNRFVPSIGTGSGVTAGAYSGMRAHQWTIDSPDAVFNRMDRVWLEGNDGPFDTGSDNAGQFPDIFWVNLSFTAAELGFTIPPSWHTDMLWTPIPTANLHTILSQNSGARPLDRDSVDTLAVTQMLAAAAGNITGSRIVAPGDLGLDLTLANNSRPITVCSNPHGIADTFGRTRIEQTLEGIAYHDGTSGIGARELETWWG